MSLQLISFELTVKEGSRIIASNYIHPICGVQFFTYVCALRLYVYAWGDEGSFQLFLLFLFILLKHF